MPNASAIIIGNEILNGKVQDTNSHTLARVLFECGVSLKRIETVPDHTETIVQTVQKHVKNFDLVFTSGGIGPTHDDITYDAIAKAFGQKLKPHEETLRRYRDFYHRDPNPAQAKMALLPEYAEILFTDNLWVPTVFIHPVYVLPGIPDLFSRMLDGIKSRFTHPAFQRSLVFSHKPEGEIAAPLEEVQSLFPDLEIGSYPQKKELEHRVMLSIEGGSAERVQEATRLIEKFA